MWKLDGLLIGSLVSLTTAKVTDIKGMGCAQINKS